MAAAEATGAPASPRIGPGVLDALVVGGGQAGLAAGYHLKRAGLSFEILEARGEPGGSWPGYYDSLKLFSPARYSGLPGMPFPGSPDRYPARDEVVGYLRDYAETFGLPVLAGKRVLRAERDAGFRLLTEDGGEHRARTLIATGYGPNLGYLGPLGALRSDGHPDQRGGVSRAVPGLYFVGLPFQSSFASATLRGVGPDAELVVAQARRQVARSATEPTEHSASVTPPVSPDVSPDAALCPSRSSRSPAPAGRSSSTR